LKSKQAKGMPSTKKNFKKGKGVDNESKEKA